MNNPNLNIKALDNDSYLLKIGIVSVQIDKKNLEILQSKIAAALDVNVIEGEELQKIFEKYDALQIGVPTLRVLGPANVNSSKEKPLGK